MGWFKSWSSVGPKRSSTQKEIYLKEEIGKDVSAQKQPAHADASRMSRMRSLGNMLRNSQGTHRIVVASQSRQYAEAAKRSTTAPAIREGCGAGGGGSSENQPVTSTSYTMDTPRKGLFTWKSDGYTLSKEFGKTPKVYPSLLGLPLQRFSDKYKLGPELGRGMAGVIRMCTEKSTGIRLAVKILPKSNIQSPEDVEDVKTEIRALKTVCSHPAVATLHHVIEDEQFVYMVMEYCAGGDLFERIKRRRRYSETDAALVVRALVSVVSFCHAQGIAHRDLKPENVLLLSASSATAVRVVDFGQAAFYTSTSDPMTSITGSAYYVAPEVLLRSYGPECDMWSLGVILYVLLCGVPPFFAKSRDAIFDKICEGEFDISGGPWRNISAGAKDLVCRMLTLNPRKRITPQECIEHPWILASCPRYTAKQPPSLQRTGSSAMEHWQAHRSNPSSPSPTPALSPSTAHSPHFRSSLSARAATPAAASNTQPRTPGREQQRPSAFATTSSAHSASSSALLSHGQGGHSQATPRPMVRTKSLQTMQQQQQQPMASSQVAVAGTVSHVGCSSSSINSTNSSSSLLSGMASSSSASASTSSVTPGSAVGCEGSGNPQSRVGLSCWVAVKPGVALLTPSDFLDMVACKLKESSCSVEGLELASTLSVNGRRGTQSIVVDSKHGRFFMKHDIRERRVEITQVTTGLQQPQQQ